MKILCHVYCDVVCMNMLYYRCEPGPQQATEHLADDLNSRPALTVSTLERERECGERELDSTLKISM